MTALFGEAALVITGSECNSSVAPIDVDMLTALHRGTAVYKDTALLRDPYCMYRTKKLAKKTARWIQRSITSEISRSRSCRSCVRRYEMLCEIYVVLRSVVSNPGNVY